jgi:hypothetical protein
MGGQALMRRERTDYERLTDNAVLLSLWARAQERSGQEPAGDRLKLMKLAFLAAYALFRDRVKALNLRFFRGKWGPMADQVCDTWADLSARSLLVDDELFVVTEEGIRLADSFTGEVLGLKQNAHVLRTLDAVVEKYAALDTAKLLDEVYSMHCYTLESPGRKHRVSAVGEGREFTRLLEEDEAEETLHVPPGWQITLELTFHPDALRNLQRGIDDIQAGRVYGWEAVGTDV